MQTQFRLMADFNRGTIKMCLKCGSSAQSFDFRSWNWTIGRNTVKIMHGRFKSSGDKEWQSKMRKESEKWQKLLDRRAFGQLISF